MENNDNSIIEKYKNSLDVKNISNDLSTEDAVLESKNNTTLIDDQTYDDIEIENQSNEFIICKRYKLYKNGM